MKKFLCGLMVGVLLSVMFVSAAADLTVVESAYDMLVYGMKVSLAKPAVTINGEYYLPAKQVSDALGINFAVNDTAKTLEFGPKPTSLSSISNPANLNTALTITYSDFMESYSAEITVKDIIRGEEAWKMLQAANRFNSPAPDGHQYLLAKINFRLLDIPDNKAFDLNNVSFRLVSSTGKVYDYALGVVLDSAIDAALYKGSANEGWAVFIVGANDPNPKIAFGRKYDGTGGVWFKAYK